MQPEIKISPLLHIHSRVHPTMHQFYYVTLIIIQLSHGLVQCRRWGLVETYSLPFLYCYYLYYHGSTPTSVFLCLILWCFCDEKIMVFPRPRFSRRSPCPARVTFGCPFYVFPSVWLAILLYLFLGASVSNFMLCLGCSTNILSVLRILRPRLARLHFTHEVLFWASAP